MPVVDASVAAKWFLAESASAEARQFLGGESQLFAPGLIAVEVASAITRRCRAGGIDEFSARRAVADWLDALDERLVTVVNDHAVLVDAINLSFRIGHPVQDCLYLALARRLDDELVTADRRFAARARRVHRRTRLIGAGG